MADATFTWNGGTGLADLPTNWTMTGVPNIPNIPQSDDDVIVASGDAQFVNMPLPGADNGTQGATVSFLGGQIDMINSGVGGTAGILANTLVQITGSVAATATLTSLGGSTNFGTIDADANGSLAFSILTGDAANAGLIEALNGGTVSISSGGSGATFTNSGQVIADGGTVIVSATLGVGSGPSSFQIGDFAQNLGGVIELNAAATSSDTFDFQDAAGTLQLDQVATFHGTILEMGSGDVVNLGPSVSINVGTIIVSPTGNANQETMTLEAVGGSILASFTQSPFGTLTFQPGTFAVDPTTGVAGDFTFSSIGGQEVMTGDPTGGIACFAAGTRIATEDGEVAVEDLQAGDRVCTIIGSEPAPIVWIGSRHIVCARHAAPQLVWPVRIAAGAFGDGLPSRDLLLSPDHAVYVDGVLVPVKHLIDGRAIAQLPTAEVTYFHVELACHDAVLANGLPTESYLANADAGMFGRDGAPVSLHPDLASRTWEAEGCAPLVVTGPALEGIRRKIREPERGPRSRRRSGG